MIVCPSPLMHSLSESDLRFAAKFEACDITAANFGHAEHLRVAYIYLAQHPFADAYEKMENGLRNLLAHLGAPPSKYHTTITAAWLLAVRHFMDECGATADFQQFLAAGGARLLDQQIMATHYSSEALASTEARSAFVAPDRQAFPRTAL